MMIMAWCDHWTLACSEDMPTYKATQNMTHMSSPPYTLMGTDADESQVNTTPSLLLQTQVSCMHCSSL
jgi:hypothetical protein